MNSQFSSYDYHPPLFHTRRQHLGTVPLLKPQELALLRRCIYLDSSNLKSSWGWRRGLAHAHLLFKMLGKIGPNALIMLIWGGSLYRCLTIISIGIWKLLHLLAKMLCSEVAKRLQFWNSDDSFRIMRRGFCYW